MPIYCLGIFHFCITCNEELPNIDGTLEHFKQNPEHTIVVRAVQE